MLRTFPAVSKMRPESGHIFWRGSASCLQHSRHATGNYYSVSVITASNRKFNTIFLLLLQAKRNYYSVSVITAGNRKLLRCFCYFAASNRTLLQCFCYYYEQEEITSVFLFLLEARENYYRLFVIKKCCVCVIYKNC